MNTALHIQQEPSLTVTGPRGESHQLPCDSQLALTDQFRLAGLKLNTRCGKRGLCDGCLVELHDGALINITDNRRVNAGATPLLVRACAHRCTPDQSAMVRIPPRSLMASKAQIVGNFKLNVSRAHDPIWRQVLLPELPRERRTAAALHHALSQAVNGGTVVVRPIDLNAWAGAPGNQAHAIVECCSDAWHMTGLIDAPIHRPLGAAIDIGTTTVALMLVELETGRCVARASALNHQIDLGDNVLTRIQLCLNQPDQVGHLQEALVTQTLEPMLADALQAASAQPRQLVTMVAAGNTTMLHLLAGVDPSSMGVAPFSPTFISQQWRRAEQLGLSLHGQQGADHPSPPPANEVDRTIHLLPGAAAYVGADVVAGMFCTGMAYEEGPSLLVDVGTNGELVLQQKDQLWACATAAGPAFEGYGLTSGMRATDGAVSHVQLDKPPDQAITHVIGECEPIGLCGSAYIDLLAQGRRLGLISARGRFIAPDNSPWANRIVETGYGLALQLSPDHAPHPIWLKESDIARLLQAKAAIAAGILTLLSNVACAPADLERVYLAGGFGLHMDLQAAIQCGLLPGVRPDQVQVVGNTSLGGAYIALLDRGAAEQMGRLGRRCEILELNQQPAFEDCFIDQLELGEAGYPELTK